MTCTEVAFRVGETLSPLSIGNPIPDLAKRKEEKKGKA
jgi:hypothetical protein